MPHTRKHDDCETELERVHRKADRLQAQRDKEHVLADRLARALAEIDSDLRSHEGDDALAAWAETRRR